jgi:hypothetical protein
MVPTEKLLMSVMMIVFITHIQIFSSINQLKALRAMLHYQSANTPWSRGLPENLTGPQLLKELPTISWNPKVHFHIHKSLPHVPVLSQINPVHAPHLTSLSTILMLPSHLCLGLPSGSFPQVSPLKPLYAPLC